jgi:regulator of RNase E activity RraB
MSISTVANSYIKKYAEDSVLMDKEQSETIELINSLINKYPNEESLFKIKEDIINVIHNFNDLKKLIMRSFT